MQYCYVNIQLPIGVIAAITELHGIDYYNYKKCILYPYNNCCNSIQLYSY